MYATLALRGVLVACFSIGFLHPPRAPVMDGTDDPLRVMDPGAPSHATRLGSRISACGRVGGHIYATLVLRGVLVACF